MNKYFVKYIETSIDSNPVPGVVNVSEHKTRFFNADDIEEEWLRFCSFSPELDRELVDITVMGMCGAKR